MRGFVRWVGPVAFWLGLVGAAFAAPVELKFLNFASTEEIYKPIYKVIEDFEKANPDIRIKNMPIGVGEIRNQFMVMTLGGNAPDVVQLHIGRRSSTPSSRCSTGRACGATSTPPCCGARTR